MFEALLTVLSSAPAGFRGIVTAAGTLPVRKTEFAVGYYNNKCFIAGGAAGSATSNPAAATQNSCYLYDVSNKSFTNLPNLPQVLAYNRGVVLDGYFYSVGGGVLATGSNAPKNTLYRINCENPTAWETMAVMPEARWSHDAFVYNGKIYVWGGSAASNSTPSAAGRGFQVYDPSNNTWSTIAASATAPTARRSSQNVLIGNLYYVTGGFISAALQDTWVCNLDTMVWTQLGNLPATRFGGFGFTFNDEAYVATGITSITNLATMRSVIKLNKDNNTWNQVAELVGPEMSCGSCFNSSTLFTFGGTPNASASAAIQNVYTVV